ncbi:hypothetical protein C8J57DRAFT_1340749 [Mycena rebaudengoi]|nr:hypothetical protein C8J57DRAFT_1340749 [Mycena rebaudengoi]
MARRNKPTLPSIKWTKNGGELIWKLSAEVEKKENRLVILGKNDSSENSTGASKTAVFKQIGSVILPAEFAIDADAVAKRVKSKYNDLYDVYKKQNKRLRQTGGGLGGNDDNEDESLHEYMRCYIPSNGPDTTTTEEAKNLWDEITNEFPFFPTFHRLVSTRPNVNPPVIITGLGPEGRKITHLQAPIAAAHRPFSNALIDPSLIGRVATPPPQLLPSFAGSESSPGTPIPWDATPSPTKPTRSPRPLTNSDKENRPTKSGKKKVKVESTPNLSQAILAARSSTKNIPAKRSFEEMLVNIHETNIEQANRRASLQDDIAKRRLMLEEKQQLIEMQKLGIYTKDEFLTKLKEIEAGYLQPKPSKRARFSSPIHADTPSDVEFA